MKGVTVVKASILFYSDEAKFCIERIFIVPKKYLFFSNKEMDIELRKIVNIKGAHLLAYKYGTINVKYLKFSRNFKEIHNVEMKDTSDWFIDPLFDKLNLESLDGRVDPIILIMGDTNRLKYRISYYLDLINKGYSKEEALSYIY